MNPKELREIAQNQMFQKVSFDQVVRGKAYAIHSSQPFDFRREVIAVAYNESNDMWFLSDEPTITKAMNRTGMPLRETQFVLSRNGAIAEVRAPQFTGNMSFADQPQYFTMIGATLEIQE